MFRRNVNNSIIMSGNGKAIINGITYDIPDGASISVNNNNVIINGKDVTKDHTDSKEISIIIQGDVTQANADNLIVEGNVVNAKAGNNLTIKGNVAGDCKAGNNIHANNINGNCKAGNNIYQ